MSFILSTISGPISEILNKVIPDSNKRAEAQEAIQQAIIQSNDKTLEAMAQTMSADAASEGWLTRSARPLTVIWALGFITYLVVFPDPAMLTTIKQIPSELWDLVKLGIGAYIAGRSVEKVAGTIAGVVRKK